MSIIVNKEELPKITNELYAQEKKFVATNGVFDILHSGHVKFLQESKKMGDILFVIIDTDNIVKHFKGEKRPINNHNERAEIIAALNCVDYVVLNDEPYPKTVLEIIKPQIYTKGGDYELEQIHDKNIVERCGGQVKILQHFDNASTTNIIKKIAETYAGIMDFKECKGHKAVFLDRDGTIIEDGGYNYKPEELVFIQGAIEALKQLKQAGYLLIVVTSQSGIARGYYTEEDYRNFNEHFLKEVGEFINAVYYCPHHKEGKPPYNIDCDCRKPKTGMIESAQKKWHVNLSQSWVIGDKTSDVKLGENAGCKTILVETGKSGSDAEYKVTPTHKAKDLLDAAKHILQNDR